MGGIRYGTKQSTEENTLIFSWLSPVPILSPAFFPVFTQPKQILEPPALRPQKPARHTAFTELSDVFLRPLL